MMPSTPLTQQQIEKVVPVVIDLIMVELTPQLHDMITRAYAAGISHGVGKANKEKALKKHEDSIAEKAKVELDWLFTQCGIGRVADEHNKQFARRMIEKHRLKAKIKTVQNWLSEFNRK